MIGRGNRLFSGERRESCAEFVQLAFGISNDFCVQATPGFGALDLVAAILAESRHDGVLLGRKIGNDREKRGVSRCRDGRPSKSVDKNVRAGIVRRLNRKSTRLNSSHQIISYAVFCLKKKKTPSFLFLVLSSLSTSSAVRFMKWLLVCRA